MKKSFGKTHEWSRWREGLKPTIFPRSKTDIEQAKIMNQYLDYMWKDMYPPIKLQENINNDWQGKTLKRWFDYHR